MSVLRISRSSDVTVGGMTRGRARERESGAERC